jgi:hypothetical protein
MSRGSWAESDPSTREARVKQAPGFKAGYWLRKDGSGLSVIICESEEAAEAIRDQIRSAPLDGVSLDDIKVREVVASA